MNKKFYPAWFFTNEKLNNFLVHSVAKLNIKKVFGIGGGGDFAFNLSSLLNIDKIDLCDIRPTANLTIDFKKCLFKKNDYQKTLRILSNPDFLKKTGLWYKYSFKQIKYKKDYLLYLISLKQYETMRTQLDKIKVHSGDFTENLEVSKSNYDLIYASNILDSKKYNQDNHQCLNIIRQKLNKNGFLLVVNQNNYKKMINLIEKFGFRLYDKERHRSNIIISFSRHYCYSFLLFKKRNPQRYTIWLRSRTF